MRRKRFKLLRCSKTQDLSLSQKSSNKGQFVAVQMFGCTPKGLGPHCPGTENTTNLFKMRIPSALLQNLCALRLGKGNKVTQVLLMRIFYAGGKAQDIYLCATKVHLLSRLSHTGSCRVMSPVHVNEVSGVSLFGLWLSCPQGLMLNEAGNSKIHGYSQFALLKSWCKS